MKSHSNEEELEKYNLFLKEILKENDFVRKIDNIFELQNQEKFQDILILEKERFVEAIEKEVLFILKKIYSEKTLSNRKFTSLFKKSKNGYESKFNNLFDDISSEWEYFNNLKNNHNSGNEEELNSYYITDFRRHCLNHEGPATHKCSRGENGKFIKISVKSNNRFRDNKELKYVACEECKKIFLKDLFNNYCPSCKENYLCYILDKNDDEDNLLVSYSNPHCDSIINKAIQCKLCNEKLYLYKNEKKLKCVKCNFIIDINNKKELQWQCMKCNKFFESGIKYYNLSENYILSKILKKALLLKTKAHPQFSKCCNLDVNNTTFYHKKECRGILYLCNVENYFLNNKKWVIVCEKCHAINNCTNFIWTCPKCGKRSRESDSNENQIKSPERKVPSPNNINKLESENFFNNQETNGGVVKKYYSSFIIQKPISQLTNEGIISRKRKEYNSNNKDKNKPKK